MNKQQSNQMASMRKKLLAAIAMLLVACIMTVSSTYAWFTLSTAPEVKGISTTIGANGNLEMALGTYATFYGTTDPSSYVGSSMANTADGHSILDANITWGNLVDLSTGYGLDEISLYPTRLQINDGGNAVDGWTVNRTYPLQFPKYGSDGRPTEMANALVGAYGGTPGSGFINNTAGNKATGVVGIGSASSMSKREFAVDNNKNAVLSNKTAAANTAAAAIRTNGGKLAAIALKYDNAASTEPVDPADIAVLQELIDTLQISNNYISESMKAAVQVMLASTVPGVLDDTKWAAAAGLAEGKDIVAFIADLKLAADMANFDFDAIDELSADYVGQYSAIKTKLDTAETALAAAGDEPTWADVETSARALLVASGIKVGGYTISEIKDAYKNGDEGGVGMSSNTVKDLFNKMNGTNGATLEYTFASNSGVFADIAKMTGNYTSSMTFPVGTVVEGLDLNMLGSKTVKVESGSTTPDKGDIGAMYDGVIDGLDYTPDNTVTEKVLTDTYGYVIDLLFRTNATESNLLLQTEAKNRYTEGAVDETMGNGSNFTFTLTDDYTKDKVDGLAAGIRVVFMDGTGKILAVAVLDTANGTATAGAYKVGLKLVNYTLADNGVITIGDDKDDAVLTALTANEKTAISALVYLDGDVIDNSHAGLAADLQAMVNLQFASSVELKPMENADLMGQ